MYPMPLHIHLYFFFGFTHFGVTLIRLSDPSVVCGDGTSNAGAEESRGLHPAQEGGGHERRPEGGRRDGYHIGPRGGLLHQV